MKKSFALIATLAAAICQAQGLPLSRPLASDIRQVSVEKPVPAHTSTSRQLTEQQRAELRRQLSQYSRPAGKGS